MPKKCYKGLNYQHKRNGESRKILSLYTKTCKATHRNYKKLMK